MDLSWKTAAFNILSPIQLILNVLPDELLICLTTLIFVIWFYLGLRRYNTDTILFIFYNYKLNIYNLKST